MLDETGKKIEVGQRIVFDANMIGGVSIIDGVVVDVRETSVDPRNAGQKVIIIQTQHAIALPAHVHEVPKFWIVGTVQSDGPKLVV